VALDVSFHEHSRKRPQAFNISHKRTDARGEICKGASVEGEAYETQAESSYRQSSCAKGCQAQSCSEAKSREKDLHAGTEERGS
jgi:hypothetical protein